MTAPTNIDFSQGTTITSEWLNGVNDTVNSLPQQPGNYLNATQYINATNPGKGLWTDWNIVPGETEPGRITYVRDRLFVGDAAKDDGIHWVSPIPATVQPDGTLDGGVAGVSYVTNRFKGSFQYLERYNQLGSFAARGGIAGSFATQASDNTSNGAPIGVSSLAFNNHSTNTQGAWCYYGVAIRDVNATTGIGALTAELHVSNMVNDSPQWDGYSANPVGMTSVLHLTQGGEHTQVGVGDLTDYDVTSAINITRFKGTNGGAFLKGIIFHKQSLAGCDGSTGIGIAMDMAKGHQLQWRYATGDAGVTGVIRCDGASHNATPRVILGTNAFSIKQLDLAEVEQPAFQVILPTLGAGEGVNGILINCQKTGVGYAGVQAIGVDTNLDIYLAPKGTGLLRTSYAVTNASTPTSLVANRRLAIKDSSGTTFYIACATTPW